MPNFIEDDVALGDPKSDLTPIGPSDDPTKFIQGVDWNEHRTALDDIKKVLRGEATYTNRLGAVADGSTITGVGTAADPFVAVQQLPAVDGVTITGDGSSGDPFVAVAQLPVVDGTTITGAGTLASPFTSPAQVADGVTITGTGSVASPFVAVSAAPSGNAILQSLRFSPPISPTLSTGTTEDWNPTGLGGTTLMRVTVPTAGATLGGLAAQSDGSVRIIENHGDGLGVYGTSPLTIKYRSLGSSVSSRFILPGLVDLVLPYTGAVGLVWDSGSGSWLTLFVSIPNDGRYDLIRTPDLQLAPAITPSALAAGDTSDYNPTSGTSTARWRLTANSSGSTLTGIVPPSTTSERKWGCVRLIHNIGSGVLTLANERTSTAGNQFNLPNARDFGIAPLDSAIIVYDETASRWKLYAGRNVFKTVDTLTLRTNLTDTLAAGDTNNYSPTDFATTARLRIIPNAGGSNLTGMAARSSGELRTITAFGTGLTIKHQNASSLTANRFYLPGGTDLVMSTGQSKTFFYDSGLPAWMVLS